MQSSNRLVGFRGFEMLYVVVGSKESSPVSNVLLKNYVFLCSVASNDVEVLYGHLTDALSYKGFHVHLMRVLLKS